MAKSKTQYRRSETKKRSSKKTTRTAAKKSAFSAYKKTGTGSHRRLHIVPSSSATEILEALNIPKSDIDAARDAIESS